MFKLGELNGGYWEYATMSLYAVDILLVGLLAYWLIVKLLNCSIARLDSARQVKLLSNKIWWLIAGLELFIFASIFFASDKWLAFYGYGRFLLGVGLFFLLTQVKYDKIKLYWIIVASGFLQSILAIQQLMMQKVYGSKWLGIASQSPEILGVSVMETELRRWLRAYGSLSHPNILGGFLVVVLLINIILYFDLHKKFMEATNVDVNKYKIGILVSISFFIINFVGLLLTFSRSAWLGFAVGTIIFLISGFFTYKRKEAFINAFKLVFVVIIISSIFFWLFREPATNRFVISNRLENKSVQERINYNQDALQIIKNNSLFGTGIKNYGLAVHRDINAERTVYEYQPVHNTFLLVWVETGIFGLLFFVGLLVVTLLHYYIITLPKHNFEMLSVVMAMTVMMFFDHWWWSLPFGVMLFWLVVGITFSKDR
ncbi:MAG: O-antigen ligase family protein [Candidatus Falkowbacteria bacterium]